VKVESVDGVESSANRIRPNEIALWGSSFISYEENKFFSPNV
jgi:hypothetical protein